MSTDIQIINRGLSRIATNQIKRIDPPSTALEVFIASNYNAWKRSELTKRRWVFAMVENEQLTKVQTLANVDRPYVYNLPNKCLRPIRRRDTEWVQRGRKLHSGYDGNFFITYIKDVEEAEFDALFEDVLAARVAVDSAEFVTQSKSKKDSAIMEYKEAITVAAQANAFIIGPEDINQNDSSFPWLQARLDGGIIG